MSICLPVCLPAYLSICLSVYLSIYCDVSTSCSSCRTTSQKNKKAEGSLVSGDVLRVQLGTAGDRKRWTATLRENLVELSGRGLKDNINMSQRLRSYSTLRKTTPTTTALLHQLNSTDHHSHHEARDRGPEDTSRVKPQLTTLTKSMTTHVHLMQQRPGLRLTLGRTCPFCWSAKGCGKT